MNITEAQLKEITEVIEDTVEYACDKHRISGKLLWNVVESLATAKLGQISIEVQDK